MTRIVHTADVHLTPDADERLTALKAILSRADQFDADVVTIGGDLFDDHHAAEHLRSSLRDVFSDRSYPILTIPGNHDADAFSQNLFFGDSFIPATTEPFDHYVIDNVRITALPYTPHATDELLVALQNRDSFDGVECLLVHCSLEAPIDGSVGDESEQRYFPISKEQLAELDFDYYLAGHYHTHHRTDLAHGGTFLYPGTPASVTRSETGPRTSVHIDTSGTQTVQLYSLDSFHYDSLSLRVTPDREQDVLDEIESQVATWKHRNVSPEIFVDGFTEMSERDFHDALMNASGDVPVTNDTRTVAQILSHPLFESFQHRLDKRDDLHAVTADTASDVETFQDDVWEETLTVFAELAAEGDLT